MKSPNLDLKILKQVISYLEREGKGGREREKERKRDKQRKREKER